MAQGNLIIIQDDKRARGDKAEYDVSLGKVTLSGDNPMALSGDSIMTAEVMIFWRDTGKFEGKGARIVPASDVKMRELFDGP